MRTVHRDGIKLWSERRQCFYHLRPVRARFEEKFRPDPQSGCWVWTGRSWFTDGRPYFAYSSRSNKNRQGARAAWLIYRGEIPDGMFVCHHCDNPLCVNPDHLFLGTVKNNKDDSMQKGRHARGEKLSKVTEQEVRLIRQWQGTQAECARTFNITPGAVSRIRSGDVWSWLK